MESIKIKFFATKDVARDQYFSHSHHWLVEIPWNATGVTAEMRRCNCSNTVTEWPRLMDHEPSLEEAIALLQPIAADAIAALDEHNAALLRAIQRLSKEDLIRRPYMSRYCWPTLQELGVAPREVPMGLTVNVSTIEHIVGFVDRYPESQVAFRRLAQILDAANAELEATIRAQQQAEQEAKRRQEAARVAQEEEQRQADRAALEAAMQRILQAQGDDADLQRWAAGRMPEVEMRDLLRADAWAGKPEFAPYERMSATALGVDDPTFATNKDYAGPLTRAQWLRMQEITGAFEGPQWTLDLREHRATWETDEGPESLSRLGVLVSTTVGGIRLSREYALPTE